MNKYKFTYELCFFLNTGCLGGALACGQNGWFYVGLAFAIVSAILFTISKKASRLEALVECQNLIKEARKSEEDKANGDA